MVNYAQIKVARLYRKKNILWFVILAVAVFPAPMWLQFWQEAWLVYTVWRGYTDPLQLGSELV